MILKKIIILLITILLLTGCARSNAPRLLDEPIVTFDVQEANDSSQDKQQSTPNISQSVMYKFASIDFKMVSGNLCRNVIQEDTEFSEMFVGNKNNFIRVATNEMEQEVFAYNYISDDFTYLYYFDGELLSKTIFNVGTGAIIQDPEKYAELLFVQAEEIKIYFNDLLLEAGLSLQELNELG